MAKPKPVAKVIVCALCDLPWADHTKGRKTEPTPDVCIRLLKAEIEKARRRPYFQAGTTATNVVPFVNYNPAVGQ